MVDQRAVRLVARPARHRQVDRVALAVARARGRTPARSPDTAATRGSRRTARSGPRGRSRSSRCRGGRPSRGSAPARRRAPPARAAPPPPRCRRSRSPSPARGSAWWPGRPHAPRTPRRRLARQQRVDQRHRPARRRAPPPRRSPPSRRCPCRCARRRRRTAPRCSRCARPGARPAAARASRRGGRTTSQPNQSCRSISASSAMIRCGPLGMAGHLVGERELVAQPDGPGHADTVATCHGPGRPHRRGRRRRRPLRRALRRARGRAGRPRSPPARWPRPPPTGRRAGSPPRSPSDDSPELHLAGHDRRRPRHRAHARPRASSPRRRPRASATSRRSACASTPTATATSRSGLEGGHSRRRVAHAGGSATGPPDPARASRGRRRAPRASTCSRAAARSRPARLADGRVTGLDTDDGRTLAARAVILATGGAAALWSRTTNPPGSFGSGLLLARAAGAALADLEFVQFHPTAVTGVPRREGFLVSEAVRGEGATLHDAERRALRRRARAARRGRPRDPRRHGRDGRSRTSHLDMRHVDPGALPQRRRRAARGRARPDARARPRLPRRPLRDGRHRHRPPRPHRRARPLRGRRDAPAPASTAPTASPPTRSVECFVFGGRAARGRARRAGPPTTPATPPPADVTPPAARDPRGGLARRRAGARRAGLHALLDDDAPARPPRRGVSAGAPGEPRRAPAQGLSGYATPALDGYHSIVTAGDTDVVHEAWD